MSSNKNQSIIIIVIVVIGIFLVSAFVPLMTPETEEIYKSWLDKDLDSGYYTWVDLDCEKGRLSMSFTATNYVTAFIMTESQFYSYQNSFSTDSLATKISQASGTLQCNLDEAQTVYFIIHNENDRQLDITEFIVNHTGEKVSLIQYLLSSMS